MQAIRGKVISTIVLLGVFSSVIARVYVFDDSQPEYEGVRTKRQLVQPPEWVFEQNNAPIQEVEMTEVRRARQSGVWDLGYDASEILQPPSSDRVNYWVKRSVEPAIVWGTPKEGAVISRPQRSPQREHDEESDEEEGEAEAGYSPEGESHHHVPASIYSFVKTDKHGNFKWAVHKGPPVRG